jgi:hypothetical protein
MGRLREKTVGEHAELKRLPEATCTTQFNNFKRGLASEAGLHVAELSCSRGVEKAGKALLASAKPELPANFASPWMRHEVSYCGDRSPCRSLSAGDMVASVPRKGVHREPRSGPKQLSRQLSLPSEEALMQLSKLDVRLTEIEQHVEQLRHLTMDQCSLTAERVGQVRTTLAQLEADANKLETKGVDGIYTSELRSGQASAKECKKTQLRRLEKLFSAIENLFCVLASAAQNA